MTLIEYMNTDVSTEKGVDAMFSFLDEYLDKFHKEGAPLTTLNIYKRVFRKFKSCAEYYSVEIPGVDIDAMDKHFDDFEHYRVLILKGRNMGGFQNLPSTYESLHRIVFDVYDKIKAQIAENRSNDIFNVLFDNNISTKEDLKKLLSKSIQLIEGNPTIPDKAKKQIVNNISEAVNEIDSPKSNWSKFLGKLSQAVILIAAISAITGYTLKDITEAEETLNNAINIIKETTVNNITITNELNIQNNIQKQLMDDTVRKKKEKE